MKIGIDIRCLSEGRRSGVEEYVEEILKSIFAMDAHNDYVLFLNAFSPIKTDLSWIQKYPNVSLCRWKIPNKLLNFCLWYFRWPKLDRLIGGVDIFFAPNINFIALSKKTKLILTVHDLSFEWYPETFSWKRRLWHVFVAPRTLCRRADRLVAVSRSTAQDLETQYHISKEKISVIPSGVGERYVTMDRNDPQLLETKEKYQLPYRFIFFLGTWEPRKNMAALVAAYDAYRDTCTGNTFSHLVLAGTPGWGSELFLQSIKQSAYRDSIHLLGFVDDVDKPALYNLAELFVYVSLYEGFGFPVLEAMRCGTPVITTNTSSLSEVTDGYALLIDPYKPNELTLAMQEILSDKKLSALTLESGRRKAYEYRWSLAGSALLEVFRETLGRHAD